MTEDKTLALTSESLPIVVDRCDLGANKTDKKEGIVEKPVPCFQLIPGFYMFQLFLIGYGYCPFTNRLFAQQGTDK